MSQRVDLFENVRQLEQCKSELLLEIAKLYQSLSADTVVENNELCEQLAKIITVTYTTGEKLGFQKEEIDRKVNNQLRLKTIKR